MNENISEQLAPTDCGNQDSFIEKYRGPLEGIVNSYNFPKEDKEELLQDTWCVFFAAYQKGKIKSNCRSFLFGILYNKMKEYFRAKKKRQLYQQFDSINEASQKITPLNKKSLSGPEAQTIVHDNLKSINLCLSCLPSKQQAVVLLKEMEGNNIEEVASMLKITPNNVRVILCRAKEKIKKCFEGELHCKGKPKDL